MRWSAEFLSHYQKWLEQDERMISDMRTCAYCGQCRFGGLHHSERNSKFSSMAPPQGSSLQNTPYGMKNSHLAGYTFDPVKKVWLVCNTCKRSTLAQRQKREQMAVNMKPDYLEKLLKSNPMDVQLLSLIDVSMNFKNRVEHMTKGIINQDSLLLSTPLVSRGIDGRPPRPNGADVTEKLDWMLTS